MRSLLVVVLPAPLPLLRKPDLKHLLLLAIGMWISLQHKLLLKLLLLKQNLARLLSSLLFLPKNGKENSLMTTIFLPKDLWTYVNMAQNGGTVIETGWLVNLDQSIVSGCQLESSGEIKEVYVRFERRISKM